MFLDEELYQMASSIKNEADIDKVCLIMVDVCFENLNKNISPKTTLGECRAQFKRVNNTWNTVVDKLVAEGKHMLKRDGFKNLVKAADPDNPFYDD